MCECLPVVFNQYFVLAVSQMRCASKESERLVMDTFLSRIPDYISNKPESGWKAALQSTPVT